MQQKVAACGHFQPLLLTTSRSLAIVRRFPEARPAQALGGCQTGTPQDAGQRLRYGPLLRFPRGMGTKIASVPATPFTWKGYAGRNFETELTFKSTCASGGLLRAATVLVPV